jgi:hypothetical protein
MFYYVAAFFIFLTIAAMPLFVMERAVFEKEHLNNLYSVVPYVLAQTIAAIPHILLISLVTSGIIVGMCGNYNYGIFFIDMFLLILVGEQIALFFSMLVPNYIIGMAIVAGLYGYFMLIEGFMKIYSEIPVGMQWSYWCAIHTYSFRIFMVNEFSEIDEFDPPPATMFLDGDAVLEFYDMDEYEVGEDLGIMFVYFFLMFAFTMAVMLIKYRTTVPKLNNQNQPIEEN